MTDAPAPPDGLHVVVIGGLGLVGANVVRAVLDATPGSRVTIVDAAEPDEPARRWLGPFGSRVALAHADIVAVDALAAAVDGETVTHVVHGAIVAHVPAWERARPRDLIDVNVGGTVNVLEWARTLPGLRRFVYLGTGGVYGEPSAASPTGPQPEEGPLDPPELYAISKLAGEQICRRYGELFDVDVRIVRLSGVFGPLERPTRGRAIMSPPWHLAEAIVQGRELRVTARTPAAGGDFLSAEDIGRAVTLLLTADGLRHRVYNIAAGTFTTIAELVEAASRAGLPARLRTVEGDADLDLDPSLRLARWNAYAIDRLRGDVDWTPRPLEDQLDTYLAWRRAS